MDKKAKFAFEMARQIAEQSDFTRTHVGCLITYKGIPIASGYNSNKTHPLQAEYNKYRENGCDKKDFIPKLHAEVTALAKIKGKELKPKKLRAYIYRIKKDGQYGMARPCPSCMQAFRDAGIKQIYYTTNESYAEEIIC